MTDDEIAMHKRASQDRLAELHSRLRAFINARLDERRFTALEIIGSLSWILLDSIMAELNASIVSDRLDASTTAIRELLELQMTEFTRTVHDLQRAITADCSKTSRPS